MVTLSPGEKQVRQYITQHFIDSGHAPNLSTISDACGLQPELVEQNLHSLAQKKGLVLQPNSEEIWIAHPFSNGPNAVWVYDHNAERGWWSNCPWCGFGVASLIRRDCTLYAKLGGEAESVEIKIRDGIPSASDLVVHFPISVPNLWNNVVYSCSMMLFHRSEDAIDDWCHRHNFKKGGVLSIEQCWRLAKGWYGSYLEKDWNRKAPNEVTAFFSSLGLDLNFRTINKRE